MKDVLEETLKAAIRSSVEKILVRAVNVAGIGG